MPYFEDVSIILGVKRGILKFPLEFVFDLTNNCNLNCLYCFNDSKNKSDDKELSNDEVLSLIDEIIKINPFNFCFSGGEPLLRRELLLECCRKLHAKNIKFNLTTNGTLLDFATCKELLSYGIREIEISLDATNPEIHQKIGRNGFLFDKIVEGLNNLRNMGFHSYDISITVTSINYKEVVPILYFADKLGINRIIIRPVLYVGRAAKFKGLLYVSQLQYRNLRFNINKLKDLDFSVGQKTIYFTDPTSHIPYFAETNTSFSGMLIRSDGTIIASPYIPIALGSIRRHKIVDYWNAGWETVWKTPLFQSIAAEVKTNGIIPSYIGNLGDVINDIDIIDNPRRLFDECKQYEGMCKSL